MIDPTKESLITLNQARAGLPGRPALNTLWRWRQGIGCGGRKLETVKLGRTVYTTKEALRRFLRDGTPTGRRERQSKGQLRDNVELAKFGL